MMFGKVPDIDFAPFHPNPEAMTYLTNAACNYRIGKMKSQPRAQTIIGRSLRAIAASIVSNRLVPVKCRQTKSAATTSALVRRPPQCRHLTRPCHEQSRLDNFESSPQSAA